MSRETLPQIDNYRHMFSTQAKPRPTLDELHQSSVEDKDAENIIPVEEAVRIKFGWIEGVLVRNMLSIWGVMLFLRISWVVAESGIWQTLVIIAISTFITLVTALSTSAITTNGEIGGGGTYYVLSRILGPEFGGSIGVLFALANAINASLNVVGFVQALQALMQQYGGPTFYIVDNGDNDIRIIGTIMMVAVWALCGLGAKYEMKTQLVLLFILLVALANFVAGSIMGPKSDAEKARGYLGYSTELFRENWDSSYTPISGQIQDFFSVFSVYFPAGIGILAGANVSGDLKDPNGAIPIGTILAIIITSLSYAVVAIICGGTMKRATTGVLADYQNGTYLDCANKNCTSGSFYDYQVMTLVSAFGPLNYAGCFAATLSTSLSSYISCPKLLQVIADDKVYPYWLVGFFGKGYGISKEPLRAYFLTFIVAVVFVVIAQLDIIAMLVTDFFLVTFAMLNYATFHICLVKPIGWRPTFKYYNMWLSLFTAVLCIVAMFLTGWPIALATIGFVILFYLMVVYRKPDVNWGSSTQALTYRDALNSIQQLVHIEEHVKNYRPQLLVLSGLPGSRPALVDFANLICKNNSLMICGNIVKDSLSSRSRSAMLQKSYKYLRSRNIKAFCSLIDSMDLQRGAAAMLEVAGVGKMKPNILLMGFKNDWRNCDRHSLEQYFGVIHSCFDLHVAVTIVRVPEGFDCTGILGDDDEIDNKLPLSHSESMASISEASSPPGTPGAERHIEVNTFPSGVVIRPSKPKKNKLKMIPKQNKKDNTLRDPAGKELPKHLVNSITIFSRKQRKGTIDVWWLYDDGGLTLLLPHIVSTRSNWSSCQLRVFCTATEQQQLEMEKDENGMAALLSKFRINYSDLIVITDLSNPPKESTKTWFDGVIRNFVRRDDHSASGQYISDAERISLQAKTDRHLRLRELLLDHSSDSNLIVMTLPMPRKGAVSAPLYNAWLEALTANMPPFLLVRGNQSSVLTFYS